MSKKVAFSGFKHKSLSFQISKGKPLSFDVAASIQNRAMRSARTQLPSFIRTAWPLLTAQPHRHLPQPRLPPHRAACGMGDAPPAVRRSTRLRKPPTARQPPPTEEDDPPAAPVAKRARSTDGTAPAPTRKKDRRPRPKRSAIAPVAEDGETGPTREPLQSDGAVSEPQKGVAVASTADPVAAEPETGPERPWGRSDDAALLKIVTWNVASCRSMMKSDSLLPYIRKENPDLLCLQETKMTEKALEECPEVEEVEGYTVHWNHSEKKGYSGVAVFVRDDLSERKKVAVREVTAGMGLREADAEGRILTCYLDNGLAVVNAYVPNSGGKLARLGFRTETFEPAMRSFLNKLAEEHRVVYCGDLNVAHMPIDIHNSKGNQKSAGHTPEERREFSTFLESGVGWTDTFRQLYPTAHGYTYYSRRFGPRLKKEGKGWRLDYHVVDSTSFARGVIGDVYIRTDVEGSDHYPLVLEYKL